jgi:hypothetical protein
MGGVILFMHSNNYHFPKGYDEPARKQDIYLNQWSRAVTEKIIVAEPRNKIPAYVIKQSI